MSLFEQFQEKKAASYNREWQSDKQRNAYYSLIARRFFGDVIDQHAEARSKELERKASHKRYLKIKADPKKYRVMIDSAKHSNRVRRAHPGHNNIDWVLGGWRPGKVYINPVTGYHQTEIMARTWQIHQLVWMEANHRFVPDGFEVDHIDGDKSNNVISNLEIVSRKENLQRYKNSEQRKQRRAAYLKRIEGILDFYYQQTYGGRIKATCNKFKCSPTSLNGWVNKYGKDI